MSALNVTNLFVSSKTYQVSAVKVVFGIKIKNHIAFLRLVNIFKFKLKWMPYALVPAVRYEISNANI